MNPNEHPDGLNVNEYPDGSLTIYVRGRLMGWVQLAPPRQGWLCNWRQDNGTWPWPHTEAPTQAAALRSVIERLTP